MTLFLDPSCLVLLPRDTARLDASTSTTSTRRSYEKETILELPLSEPAEGSKLRPQRNAPPKAGP